MRYRELLVEFDLSKTAINYGERLIKRLLTDDSAPNFRVWYAKLTFGKEKPDGGFFDQATERAVGEIMKADPTPTHSYVRWIAQRYIDGGIARAEDFDRVHHTLAALERLKKSGHFVRNRDQSSDINRYRTLADLETFMDQFQPKDMISNAAADKPTSSEYRIVLDTDKWRIVVPLSQKAASFFGRNTKWCTTAENGSQFNSYKSRGDLYVIIDKPANRRWQWHFPSQQFMDERDRPFPFNKMPEDLMALIPAEMIIAAANADSLDFVRYLPKDFWKVFTPEQIAQLPSDLQASFVMFSDVPKIYEASLAGVKDAALCHGYSVGWHWEKGPAMLSELRKRSENSPEPRVTEHGKGWTLYQFSKMYDALYFDIRKYDHSALWRSIDSEQRTSFRDYGRQFASYTNVTLVDYGDKRLYFFRTSGTNSGYLRLNWEGRSRNFVDLWRFEDATMKPDPQFEGLTGPFDPEMWQTIMKSVKGKL